MKILVMLMAAFALCSCATRGGLAEFSAYRDAFEASRASAGSLFDLLEVSERRAMASTAELAQGGPFEVDAAVIHSTLVDPPLATAYRRGFDVVTQYNSVLAGFATGRRGEELSADIYALGGRLVALAGIVAPGVAPSASLLGIAEPARQILDIALARRSEQAFRETLVETEPDVQALIDAMIEGAPRIFDTIAPTPGVRNEPERIARREEVLVLVSDFVVLLRRVSDSLRAAAAAAAAPQETLDAEALDRAVTDMETAARALRLGVAGLLVQP